MAVEELIARRETSARMRREEAMLARMVEAQERSALPCDDCEVGEPHVCERAWWQQRSDHLRGRECIDPDCLCHPEECGACGQPITRDVLLRRAIEAKP